MNKGQNPAYGTVVSALEEVNRYRTFRSRGKPGRRALDRAVLLLEELSWKVVSEDLATFAERMKAASRELAGLGREIGSRYARLKKVSGCLRKAAEAAGRAADAVNNII